jgi:hypothetical protein
LKDFTANVPATLRHRAGEREFPTGGDVDGRRVLPVLPLPSGISGMFGNKMKTVEISVSRRFGLGKYYLAL